MGRILLLVGFGGFIGSVCRYILAVSIDKAHPHVFPYGTFAVNIAGCLLAGIFFGLAERHEWFSAEWKLFLITGFCGGFTTFSAFALDNLILFNTSKYFALILYSSASYALGLLAAFAGVAVIRQIL